MTEGGASGHELLLIVSVDTEEDNWKPARRGITVKNIREIPRLDRFFERLSIRATYFTAYQVALQGWAANLLRDIACGPRVEIGAHLHPWNTPPMTEALRSGNSMLHNLPVDLQLAKLRCLTDLLESCFATRPRSFRAGRFGLGLDTVKALIECGYEIDSSVSPFVDWKAYDAGPNFVGAPIEPYRIGATRDVRVPEQDGPILEVPVSVGYSRFSPAHWLVLNRILESRPARLLHVAGLAYRCGLVHKAILSPELRSTQEMLSVSRRLLDGGVQCLQIYFHSSSLRPGLTPYTPTLAAVDRLYDSIERYVDGLARLAPLKFVTVSEAASAIGWMQTVSSGRSKSLRVKIPADARGNR